MVIFVTYGGYSLHHVLCSEYPDISGPLIASTIARATQTAARLDPEMSPDRLAALTRGRLDAVRARLTAATQRSTRTMSDGPSPNCPELLCRTAGRVLGAATVAVAVPDPALTLRTIGSDSTRARSLVRLEGAVGQGPCLEAVATGTAVVADRLDEPAGRARRPLFAPACSETGVVAICAVPLRMGAARCGVLAVYLTHPVRRAAQLLEDATGFAETALAFLLGDAAAPTRTKAADNPEIHHATGMTAVQLGVDLGTAVIRLRERALADDRPLLDLAADVVARRVRFDRADA